MILGFCPEAMIDRVKNDNIVTALNIGVDLLLGILQITKFGPTSYHFFNYWWEPFFVLN
jgi:hypothetical protein